MQAITKVFSDIVKPYIDAEIVTRATLGAHNLFGVGNSLNEWFAGMNDGKLPTNYLASDTITGTVNKDTNSIVISAYDTSGYRWGCKKINLEKNKRYTFSRTSCNGTIQLFGKNNADDRAVVISGLSNGGTVNSGDYDWWYVGFYPTFTGGYFSITDLLVRLETDADLTYQPYAKPNTELTKDDIGLTANAFANGAVNLLENKATSQVINGITWVVNSDGTITARGTATNNSFVRVANINNPDLTLDKGIYRFVACPSGGSTSNYYAYITDGQTQSNDYGNGVEFNVINDNTDFAVVLYVINGQTVNITFKPMITVADMPNSDYDHYVPYAKTNSELTKNLEMFSDAINREITTATAWSDLENMCTYVMDGVPFTGNWSIVLVLKRNENTGVQIAFKVGAASDVSSNYIAYRMYYNGTWSNWSAVNATNMP